MQKDKAPILGYVVIAFIVVTAISTFSAANAPAPQGSVEQASTRQATTQQAEADEVECKKELPSLTPAGIVIVLLGCKSEPREDIDCLPTHLHQAANSLGGSKKFCVDGKPSAAAEKLGYVSRAAFEVSGKKWPLSVDEGFVGCTGTGARWFEKRDGRAYGLNGLASVDHGYQDIKAIWLENTEVDAFMSRETRPPGVSPLRISIFDLSQAAAARCS